MYLADYTNQNLHNKHKIYYVVQLYKLYSYNI